MVILDRLLRDLQDACFAFPDKRKGEGEYTMADIGLSAFSLFFMQSESFLSYQRSLEEGRKTSNCQTLFGMKKIPTDNHIRSMLDPVHPMHLQGVFDAAVTTLRDNGGLEAFQRLGGRVPIALDGTEHFCSQKLGCPNCQTRKRSNGKVESYHTMLAATLVAPGHNMVVPLMPEFIVKPDGAQKQDCERNAAKRWLAKHGTTLAPLRPIYLGDDLFACQPIAEAIHEAGGSFILTCKPASHKTITEYLHGAELQEHRQTICKRGKRTTTIYRWLSAVPLRGTSDAMAVNWFSIEVQNAKGKRTYHNSFVTDLTVTAATVAELAACGRARWKIENETFNVLKTTGYNLEHNFGHGKETLASVLVTLNLLAFAYHTAAYLAVLAWRAAVIARGATYRFFEHLRTITTYVVFQDWSHLLDSIAASAIRPP